MNPHLKKGRSSSQQKFFQFTTKGIISYQQNKGSINCSLILFYRVFLIRLVNNSEYRLFIQRNEAYCTISTLAIHNLLVLKANANGILRRQEKFANLMLFQMLIIFQRIMQLSGIRLATDKIRSGTDFERKGVEMGEIGILDILN